MNIQLLKQHISTYKKWLHSNSELSHQEQIERRSLSLEYQAYTKERMLGMTKEDIYEYIAPLWAMLLWGNKKYVIDKLIANNELEQLSKQLANLVWGADKLENRWNEFRKKIKGMGPAMMSELLCKTHPNDCVLWNRRALVAFNYLEIYSLPRYDYQFTGKMYSYLCEQAKSIAKIMNEEQIPAVDLLTVDYFIWQELQVQTNLSKISFNKTPKEAVEQVKPIPAKEAEFIHNDIRDKLAEIGRWLGFNTEIERKVADGAKVDAVWEVTIGNMGRVIYVFEVQTSGSIDSLLLNLMKAKNNKAVQGIVAVTDQKQIEKIKRESGALNQQFNGELKFWNYQEVLKIHESLQYVNESINNLGLVPFGL